MPEPRSRGVGTVARRAHVALAGNPNVGKSSLYNQLTGARQHVANWPGKTVERHAGSCALGATEVEVVDLPGTYSLAGSSPEEQVAAAALTDPDLDAVVLVLDSMNLERNLYLAAQVAELGRPLVAVLNLTDEADRDGLVLDHELLGRALGAPVVRTVARTGGGLDELRTQLDRVIRADAMDLDAADGDPERLDPSRGTVAGGPHPSDPTVATRPVPYGPEVDVELAWLVPRSAALDLDTRGDARWWALRLLEEDPDATHLVRSLPGGAAVMAEVAVASERIRAATGVPAALVLADRRYAWAHRVAAATVRREMATRSATDRLDAVLTHPWLGLPIFLALMWLTFTLVVEVADPFIGWIEELTEGPLARLGTAALALVGLGGSWVEGVLVEGLLAGLGAVLVFLPVLSMLYLALGVLEDSGYMARGAFLMDRVMAPIGLSGRSFLPLLLGFGCNVPGVYATRVLDRRRDRILTGLLVPFVTCAARLPVYVLLATVFFAGASGTVVFGLYLLSLTTVLALGGVLDRIVLRGERTSSFILELPAYRRPGARVLGRYVGHRVGAFVTGAGPVILAGSVGVWLLLAIPAGGDGSFADTDLDDSAFAATSRVLAPTLAPAGFGSWEVTGTLMTGMVAKEIMVASFWQVFDVEPRDEPAVAPTLAEDLAAVGTGFVRAVRDGALAVPAMVGLEFRDTEEEGDTSGLAAPLRAGLTAASGGHPVAAALALMVFVLLYVPCFATIGALRQELGTRWALLSVALSLSVAWVGATLVFQTGRLLGHLLGGG
jgi:ferrous iron transport protein B